MRSVFFNVKKGMSELWHWLAAKHTTVYMYIYVNVENVLINGYMNFLSKRYIKMFAYEWVHIVPTAQLFVYKQFLLLKIKLFSVGIKAKNVVITFVKVVRLEYFSKNSSTDLIPSKFGILVYNDFTFRETRCDLSGTKSNCLVFLRKSVVSQTYYGISLTIG